MLIALLFVGVVVVILAWSIYEARTSPPPPRLTPDEMRQLQRHFDEIDNAPVAFFD